MEKTIVERVRDICKDRGIPIKQLEYDLGFGNGYLNPKKIKTIQSDRLEDILDYLEITYEELMGGDPPKPMTVEEFERELDASQPYDPYSGSMRTWIKSHCFYGEDEDKLMKLFRAMSDDKKKQLLDYATFLSSQQDTFQSANSSDKGTLPA